MPSADRYRNTLWHSLATWIGAATMLTWLSYGHAARRIVTTSYLQLDSTPRPMPIGHGAPDATGLTAKAASSPISNGSTQYRSGQP